MDSAGTRLVVVFLNTFPCIRSNPWLSGNSPSNSLFSCACRYLGEVTLTATVTNLNLQDDWTFSWQPVISGLSTLNIGIEQTDKNTLVFDPSELDPGAYSVIVEASNSVLTKNVEIELHLIEVAPILSSDEDSDSDGDFDFGEGYDDSDGDGIVDYLDNIDEFHLAPVNKDSNVRMQAQLGNHIKLGSVALLSNKNVVKISEVDVRNADIRLDERFSYPDGLYNFAVSGQTPGSSYYLVLPQIGRASCRERV